MNYRKEVKYINNTCTSNFTPERQAIVIKKIIKAIHNYDLSQSFKLPGEEWPAIVAHILNNKITPSKTSAFDNSRYFNGELPDGLLKELQELIQPTASKAPYLQKTGGRYTFIDLFAGIGGFRLSLQAHGGKCVFSSEWDKSAKETYFKNYGEYPFGDIRHFTENHNEEEINALIPDHDILAAGFPCQPFSHAGVSARNSLNQNHGFKCDTQGTLFHDIIKIARIKKPKVLFLENVKNLKSHDGGSTFKVIESAIKEIGYKLSHELINAQSLVPQKRVRCYMIAVRNDLPEFKIDLTPFTGPPIALSTILESKEAAKDYQISEKLWQGHISRTERNIARGTGFTAHEVDISKPSNTLVARYGKDGKECLIPMENGPPRKLTKREAARLQGYPDDFVLPASRTPTYKQMGNSVAIPVVMALSEQIIKHLDHV